MKISHERFEELISLYLDNEASAEELKLLAECVRANPQMYTIFVHACKIHVATCQLYGKNVFLRELEGVPQPFSKAMRPSKVRDALEWAGVAALLAICAILAPIAFSSTNKTSESNFPKPYKVPEADYYLNISFKEPSVTLSEGTFSIINISSINSPAVRR